MRVVVVDGPDSWAKSLVRRWRTQRVRSRSARAHPVRRPGRRYAQPARRTALGSSLLRRQRPLAPCRAVPAPPHCPPVLMQWPFACFAQVTDGIAEKFIAVDMRDADTVFERTLEEIKGLTAEGLTPDGVCTFNEMSVPIAARLAEALGLPGNPVAAVDAARDKFATRAIMQDAGLPTPANSLIEKAADLDAAAANVGFPAVIKPIAGAGSMCVTPCIAAHLHMRVLTSVRCALSQGRVPRGQRRGAAAHLHEGCRRHGPCGGDQRRAGVRPGERRNRRQLQSL